MYLNYVSKKGDLKNPSPLLKIKSLQEISTANCLFIHSIILIFYLNKLYIIIAIRLLKNQHTKKVSLIYLQLLSCC